jgi:hypothetical protein
VPEPSSRCRKYLPTVNENDLLVYGEKSSEPEGESWSFDDFKPKRNRPDLLWLMKLLIKASSMTAAEAQAVQALQDSSLQVSAVANLVTLSTDPRVTSIALQSLAGLHAYDPRSFHPSLKPSWLLIKASMVKYARELHHSRFETAIGLRVLRGGVHHILECQEINSVIGRRLRDPAIGTPLSGPILALIANECQRPEIKLHTSAHLLKWIVGRPFGELLQLHPWDLFQVRKALHLAPLDIDIEVSIVATSLG